MPMVVIGLGIGWLVGLSETVISGMLVTAVLTVIGAAGVGANYLKPLIGLPNGSSPDLKPLAYLAISTAVAATGGTYFRLEYLTPMNP